MNTKKADLKQRSSELAVKYGSKTDNFTLGFEYLCLEMLAHDPLFSDELVSQENSNLDVRKFHTGGSGDGGIDGILYNEELTNVVIIQSKFKQRPMDSDTLEEARSFFFRLPEWLNPNNSPGWNDQTNFLLQEASLSPKDQDIDLYFMTSMTATDRELYLNLADEATASYQDRGWRVTCYLLTQSDMLQLIDNTEITKLSSTIAPQKFKISSDFSFEFTEGEYKVLTAAVHGNEIGSLYNRNGVRQRLFNSNIRAGLSKSGRINKKIKETALSKDEAGNFFYYNNGITATCSNYEVSGSEVYVEDLQVVNGAQTVTALADASRANRAMPGVYVLLRLIETEGGKRKHLIADQITRFQNTQNPVKVSDFFSNEPINKAIENYFTDKSGRGAFPSIWYEFKRGVKPSGSVSGRKKITLETLTYLRYACLEDPTFTYKYQKDVWDGQDNNRNFWTAMGQDYEPLTAWTEEEIAKTGWMIRCWLHLRQEQAVISKDKSDRTKDNPERHYLGVMARYVTALTYYGMEFLQKKEDKFPSWVELMASEKYCSEIEKKMIQVARRVVRAEYNAVWLNKVANPRLNMPQNADAWSQLKKNLITEYFSENV